MYVEFYNLSQDKAYYATGSLDDLVAMVGSTATIEHMVDCGVDEDLVIWRIGGLMNQVADLDPGDSFQVRLFTMEPDSPILTKRIQTRAVYWPKWMAAHKAFVFDKVVI
jgi:hypothetical protein